MADLQIVPASCKSVEAQYVEMKVPLYSYGCERKVRKALSHLKGIYSVQVDFMQQKVTVWGICNKHDVLATIKNKRKDAVFWNTEDNTKQEEEEEEEKPEIQPAKEHYIYSLSKTKSFSLRALKKVFTRSHSF